MLALVVVLQGAAVGVFVALGPAHMHKSEAPPLVLVDSRRWKPSPPAKIESSFLALLTHGHSHGKVETQRHYHAFDDRSVVGTGDDGLTNGSDIDDLSASASLASVLALMPESVPWAPAMTRDGVTIGSMWAWLTGFTAPLERPPQHA